MSTSHRVNYQNINFLKKNHSFKLTLESLNRISGCDHSDKASSVVLFYLVHRSNIFCVCGLNPACSMTFQTKTSFLSGQYG